jgi:CDP-diacylglycerol--glycerol-3-phosphate 3-phosphatidyltransferase
MTLANRITIARMGLIPIFAGLLLYYQKGQSLGQPDDRLRIAAFVVFAVAAFSDGIDGYVARHFNQRSKLGAVLDPLADKLLILTALILLSFIHFEGGAVLPLWFPVLCVSRDLFVIGGCALLYGMHRRVDVAPHFLGKVALTVQLLIMGFVMLKWPFVREACFVSAAASVGSLWFYSLDLAKQIRASGIGDPGSNS